MRWDEHVIPLALAQSQRRVVDVDIDRAHEVPLMVNVGDRIRLSSAKGPDREGVVTAVTGSMVRVRWPAGQETTVIPAPGTLTVLAPSKKRAPKATRKPAAPGRVSAEKATTKKGEARKAAPKKAPPASGTSRKPATAKKAATKTANSTKGGAKKPTTGKRSSR